LLILVLYFATGLVRSETFNLNLLLRFNKLKNDEPQSSSSHVRK
jgi:hypothetical protein